jgi:hypothetical protein
MFTLAFLLTTLTGLVTAHIPLEKGVLVLDDHNFDDAIAVSLSRHCSVSFVTFFHSKMIFFWLNFMHHGVVIARS